MRDTSSASAVNDGETGPATPFWTKDLKMNERVNTGKLKNKKHKQEIRKMVRESF